MPQLLPQLVVLLRIFFFTFAEPGKYLFPLRFKQIFDRLYLPLVHLLLVMLHRLQRLHSLCQVLLCMLLLLSLLWAVNLQWVTWIDRY